MPGRSMAPGDKKRISRIPGTSILNAAAILLSAGQAAKTIASCVYLPLAIALVWRDCELFLQGPRNFIEGRVSGQWS